MGSAIALTFLYLDYKMDYDIESGSKICAKMTILSYNYVTVSLSLLDPPGLSTLKNMPCINDKSGL